VIEFYQKRPRFFCLSKTVEFCQQPHVTSKQSAHILSFHNISFPPSFAIKTTTKKHLQKAVRASAKMTKKCQKQGNDRAVQKRNIKDGESVCGRGKVANKIEKPHCWANIPNTVHRCHLFVPSDSTVFIVHRDQRRTSFGNPLMINRQTMKHMHVTNKLMCQFGLGSPTFRLSDFFQSIKIC
jgi:hypothetical protein